MHTPCSAEATVLVTGVGGAAGTGVMRSLANHGFEVVAADANRFAPGLFLVPEPHRCVLPPADSPDFLHALLDAGERFGVDVIVPTADDELVPLAGAAAAFERLGVRVVCPHPDVAWTCADHLALDARLRNVVPMPRTRLLDGHLRSSDLRFPQVARARSAGEGFEMRLLLGAEDLAALPADATWVLQPFLPGNEFEVLVSGSAEGGIRAVVPIAVSPGAAGRSESRRTIHSAILDRRARQVFLALRLSGPATLRFREDRLCEPRLLGVHPRLGAGAFVADVAGVPMAAAAVRDRLGLPPMPMPRRFSEVATVAVSEEIVVPLKTVDQGRNPSADEVDAFDGGQRAGKPPPLLH